MAAKVYSSPIAAPTARDFTKSNPYSFDRDGLEAAETKYTEDLRLHLVQRKAGQCVGEVISFGVADGQALYMVAGLRPLELVHMPLGDKWQVSSLVINGLTAAIVKRHIEAENLFVARTGSHG